MEMGWLFPDQKEAISVAEKAFVGLPEIRGFFEAGILYRNGKSALTKGMAQEYSTSRMLARYYSRAGLTGLCSIQDFVKEENICVAFEAIKNANTAQACMKVLRKIVSYLKAQKILSDEYSLPKISYRTCDIPFKIDPLETFNPFRDIDSKLMQLVCLLAADMHLRTTRLAGLKTADFDLSRKKLVGMGKKEATLSDSIVAFLMDNPDLLKGSKYLLSIDGRQMSAKTLTRRFHESLASKYKGKIKLQTLASAHKNYKYEKTVAGNKRKPVSRPVQIDLF